MDNDSTLTPNKILTGELLYAEAINIILGSAQTELLIFDQNLGLGDFASRQKIVLFEHFLNAKLNSQLTIVLQNTTFFQEKCPRLLKLLETYGHKMTVYETNDTAKHAKDCFILADGKHYIKRIHIDQARFKYALDDVETVRQLNSRFGELLEATQNKITVTNLGL